MDSSIEKAGDLAAERYASPGVAVDESLLDASFMRNLERDPVRFLGHGRNGPRDVRP